ncbi:hypothetical protein HDU93_008351 [Gonapodya sp. JEL0774]|nr:hypothetical protein HDU93_008351 [Gonapodya sp. JEL0774]
MAVGAPYISGLNNTILLSPSGNHWAVSTAVERSWSKDLLEVLRTRGILSSSCVNRIVPAMMALHYVYGSKSGPVVSLSTLYDVAFAVNSGMYVWDSNRFPRWIPTMLTAWKNPQESHPPFNKSNADSNRARRIADRMLAVLKTGQRLNAAGEGSCGVLDPRNTPRWEMGTAYLLLDRNMRILLELKVDFCKVTAPGGLQTETDCSDEDQWEDDELDNFLRDEGPDFVFDMALMLLEGFLERTVEPGKLDDVESGWSKDHWASAWFQLGKAYMEIVGNFEAMDELEDDGKDVEMDLT